MEKIFYRNLFDFPSSADAVRCLLTEKFHLPNVKLTKTENGKPYLKNSNIPLHFSLSHTQGALFIAFCDENVGIDAEFISRQCNYLPIIQKFTLEEREEIRTPQDFLLHWTVKEAAVKWLGGSLSQDLKKLVYAKGTLHYEGLPLPVHITIKTFGDYLLSICSERDFSHTDIL